MPHRFKSVDYDVFVETWGEWETICAGDPSDPVFTFSVQAPPISETPGGRRGQRLPFKYGDAFEIRHAFFGVHQPNDALELFQKFGPWQIDQLLGSEARDVRYSELIREQDQFRDFLLDPEMWLKKGRASDATRTDWKEWYLRQNLSMELPFRRPPVMLVRCQDIKVALRATVYLDQLERFPFRLCAREGCGRPFKMNKDPRKQYCSSECAHLQASRAWNERKRAERRGETPPPKKRVKKGKNNGDL